MCLALCLEGLWLKLAKAATCVVAIDDHLLSSCWEEVFHPLLFHPLQEVSTNSKAFYLRSYRWWGTLSNAFEKSMRAASTCCTSFSPLVRSSTLCVAAVIFPCYNICFISSYIPFTNFDLEIINYGSTEGTCEKNYLSRSHDIGTRSHDIIISFPRHKISFPRHKISCPRHKISCPRHNYLVP